MIFLAFGLGGKRERMWEARPSYYASPLHQTAALKPATAGALFPRWLDKVSHLANRS